jgi:hypothetical protein
VSNRIPTRNRKAVDAAVLRRRRIIALAAAFGVLLLLWAIVNSVIGFFSSLLPSSNSTPTPTQAVVQPCAPGMVQVMAGIGDANRTQKSTIAAGENPFLWFNITNNSKVACTFDAGSAVSFYKISSGEQLIWDSQQCDRSQDVSAVGILNPGQSVDSPASTWLRVFSSSTGCSTGQKPAVAGGATYQLKAIVNGVQSSTINFILN